MTHKKLISWYIENHRILPWRETKDPYIIWLSEIILQQTRVAQGLPYFEKFIQNYPNVQLLANDSEQNVLKLWQGLGYYSRGRNLHYTAKYISSELNGFFPTSYKELIKLKGIGSYTAAAIASFAFDEPVAVLDGNVFRVLSRFYLEKEPINTTNGKKIFESLASDFLNKCNPALHNQAIMELGATICLPKNPSCHNCPIASNCKAYNLNLMQNLPVKEKKLKVKSKYFYYFHFFKGSKTVVFKRPKGGIWQNLYDLPLIVYDEFPSLDLLIIDIEKNFGIKLNKMELKPFWVQNHILTHQKIQATFYRFEHKNQLKFSDELNYLWVNQKEMHNLPVSRLFEKYLQFVFG
jgi:A/G-specific adenine glycosylase